MKKMHGIIAVTVTPFLADGAIDYTTAAKHLNWLIDSGVPFDGVIALNDQLAIGALTALRTAGYEVPVQVQVIGFDNNEEAPYLQIPLTTMDSRLDWTAPTAVNRILGRIDGSITKSELLTTESQVIARASTR